jgi:bla regulator protein BlaR1
MISGRFGARALIIAAACMVAAPLCGWGQAPASEDKALAFDVVSIRPAPSSSPGHEQMGVTPDGWHMTHGTLLAALLTAYIPTTSDAMMYTVSTLAGVPDWMRTETYDIDAKVPEADLAAWRDPAKQTAMLRSMMQTMLADRCKLVVHRGSHEVSVYLLVVGKSGPKLKAAVPGEVHQGGAPLPGGGEFLPNDGTGSAAFYDAPIRALAVVLSNFAGRPVEDRTGLTGRYDMTFRRPRPGAPSTEDDSSNPPPTIFEVVESFGLKLEPAKSSVETLVVDHVERPSEN